MTHLNALIPPIWLEETSEEGRQAFSRFLSTLPESYNQEPFDPSDRNGFEEFVKEVALIDRFYGPLGGIEGYYNKVLSLLDQTSTTNVTRDLSLKAPPGWNLQDDNPLHLLFGIISLPLMGEIYPLGGAGDRLSLICDKTNEALPAACLPFLGRNLLEGLIRDLQGREALFFKLFGKSIQTPIALMTSDEKENHGHILRLLEASNWFHRSPASFRLFKQPQAPLISLGGEWMFARPWKLAMKPGGHGLLWKLAREEGVFKWFEANNRSKVIVRQINNPVAGLDSALIAFLGIGVMEDKGFGFLSCPRRVGAPEGVNLLIEDGETRCLTAVEYTDFSRFGIIDEPESPESPYSKFPSNTNILFGDLSTLHELSLKDPFPGILLNPKTKVSTFSRKGPDIIEKSAGRLETLMQAVGDLLKVPKEAEVELKTFVAFNERKKTISPTKRAFEPGKGIEDTPEGAYFDLISTMKALLKDRCQVELSENIWDGLSPPPFSFHYHPALGPPFGIIGQKISRGKLHSQSELLLEIGEISLKDFEIRGSLVVEAKCPLGVLDENDLLSYSHAVGKCRLHHVQISNQGIDFEKTGPFWKQRVNRKESLEIILEGDSFFEAVNVVFEGSQKIVVPDGWHYRMTPQGLEKLPLKRGLPLYSYTLSPKGELRLELNEM